MMTKLKLALALSGSLLASIGGIASAQNWGGSAGGSNIGPRKAAILQKYDANGDGQLDAQEKAAMRADFQAKRQAKKQEMVAKYDTNKDGKLEPAERQVMRAEKAAKLFEKIDVDHNGVITLNEFKQAEGKLMRHARFGRGRMHRRGFVGPRGSGNGGPGFGGGGMGGAL